MRLKRARKKLPKWGELKLRIWGRIFTWGAPCLNIYRQWRRPSQTGKTFQNGKRQRLPLHELQSILQSDTRRHSLHFSRIKYGNRVSTISDPGKSAGKTRIECMSCDKILYNRRGVFYSVPPPVL